MQAIAHEINFSETVFIRSDKPVNGGYDTRIFMPAVEVPFAGHPTLGAAYIIREYLISQPVDQVRLNLPAGQIPVTFHDDGLLWMEQNAPEFMETYSVEEWAGVLGLSLDDFDSRFPIQTVSTGLAFTIVPLKTLDADKRARVDGMALRSLLASSRSIGPLVFAPETYRAENALNVRVLEDIHGAPEDPATGSANGDLAAYLLQHGYFNTDDVNITTEQGYEIGRPSRLYLRAERSAGRIRIRVGGWVQRVAQGIWLD
jgi:trans-2,3-dihydro-3-hydroxyanthranilate isomerase